MRKSKLFLINTIIDAFFFALSVAGGIYALLSQSGPLLISVYFGASAFMLFIELHTIAEAKT